MGGGARGGGRGLVGGQGARGGGRLGGIWVLCGRGRGRGWVRKASILAYAAWVSAAEIFPDFVMPPEPSIKSCPFC